MEFVTFEETHQAFHLTHTILDKFGEGSDVLISRHDVEIVALGLILIVRLSAYAAHFPMIELPRD